MIESAVSKNLIKQFKQAIQAALASKPAVRAQMRARAAKQRFPVAQWVEDLSLMQDDSIKINQRELVKKTLRPSRFSGVETPGSGSATPRTPGRFWGSSPLAVSTNATASAMQTTTNSAIPSGLSTRAPSPTRSSSESGVLSLGTRHGPGHVPKREGRQRKRLSKPPPGSRDSSIGAQLKRFSRSRRSSRNISPVCPKSSDKNPSMNTAPREQAGSGTLTPRGRSTNRVSRITEIMDEDGAATACGSQGDIQRFDFRDNAAEEPTQRGSSVEGSDEDVPLPDEVLMSPAEVEESRNNWRLARLRVSISQMELNAAGSSMPPFAPPPVLHGLEAPLEPGTPLGSSTPLGPGTPMVEDRLLEAESCEEVAQTENPTVPDVAHLSLGGVLQGKKDYKLQSVEPFFTDPTGLYYNAFDKKLENLNPKNSESQLCIEEYLMKSEKDWFQRFHNVKMGKSAASTPASSIFRVRRDDSSQTVSERGSPPSSSRRESFSDPDINDNNPDQFLLQETYKPPTGIKKYLLYRIVSWPAYSFLLALVRSIQCSSSISILT